MKKSDFGNRLRFLRQQSRDPLSGKQLSQHRLGELMQDEIGIRYSGAAISDWERGESVISANDRLVLLGLIGILKRLGGIQTLSDANSLLEAGDYRSLNHAEAETIFPDKVEHSLHDPLVESKKQIQEPSLLSDALFSPLIEEWSKLIARAKGNPPPIWPHVMAWVIGRATDQITSVHVFRAVIWLWIWVTAYFLVTPSLRLSSGPDAEPFLALVLYAVGSVILPLFIGIMANTTSSLFWRELKTVSPFLLRLYTYQGAYVGFHVGYFLIFLFMLLQNLLILHSPLWFEFVKTALPLVVGYTGARLIPHNLWLAYGRLHLRDGGIFFIFILFGPLWAWFYWEFHEILGSPVIGGLAGALGVTLLAATKVIRRRRP